VQLNVGGVDRKLRIIVGILVLASFFVLPEQYKYWALIGIVPLVTGFFSFCPLYSVLGMNTCARKD